MNLRHLVVALVVVCCSNWAMADILLAGITEATGGGSVAGTNFRNGYMMAIDEINTANGVLGQPLVLRQFDIDSNEAAARQAATDALAIKPFAVLGPVFSSLTLATMEKTSPAGVPHFTGGEAASLTQKFHPSLLRTSLTQQSSIPRLAAFTVYGLGAKQIGLLSVDNEFGRHGRDILLNMVARKHGRMVFDERVPPGAKDVSAVVQRLMASPSEAVVLILNEGESLLVLKELRRQGFRKPIVGDSPVLSPSVIEDPQAVAEGVIGHTGLSVDLPVPAMTRFVANFQRRFGKRPDHNALKGYFAVQVLKVGLTAVGRPDASVFLKHVKNTRLDGHVHPELMTSSALYYDFFGDLNRESYLVQVHAGKLNLLASMGAVDSPFVELPTGKTFPLNSDEFRRELQNSLVGSGTGKKDAGPKAMR